MHGTYSNIEVLLLLLKIIIILSVEQNDELLEKERFSLTFSIFGR